MVLPGVSRQWPTGAAEVQIFLDYLNVMKVFKDISQILTFKTDARILNKCTRFETNLTYYIDLVPRKNLEFQF
jgi:hypothetical protein